MSNNANSIALRSILVLGALIFFLVQIRSCEFENPLHSVASVPEIPTPSPTPVRIPEEPIPKPSVIARPTVAQTPPPVPVKLSWIKPSEEPIPRPVVIRRPAPVQAPPVERNITVKAEPRKWSALVNAPRGKGGKFSFTLGRVEVEMNGVVQGPFYRAPVFERSDRNPDAIRIKPLAIFDKSPHTVWFGPDVETLRFRSLERSSGDIEIEFEP